MKIFLILVFCATSCFAGSYDGAFLRFFGGNYSDYQNLTISSNFSSINGTKYFNASKLSVLIIHGYQKGYNSEVGPALVSAFHTRPNYNIIFGDWSANSSDFYPTIIYNLNDIADTFVLLLNKTKTAGYDLTKFYLVGEGIGAHLAGRMGSILKTQNVTLPRITGLDPTGVFYNWAALIAKLLGPGANFTPIKPLFKGDASFVDVIHTNSFFNGGLDVDIGDVDFWPNGGMNQPMCSTNCSFANLFTAAGNCSVCNHLASINYYAESVKSTTVDFSSFGCPNFTLSKSATSCTGPATAYMGFYANSSAKSGGYYVETNAASPYSK